MTDSAGDFSDFQELQKDNLLAHFEKIVTLSEKNGLTKTFFNAAKPHIKFITHILPLSPLQTVLFAHFLNRCDDQAIRMEDIAGSIKCSKIRVLQYINEFDALEQQKLICGCRERRCVSYRVPLEVISALRKNESFKPADLRNISISDFFTALETRFEQRNDNELTYDALTAELKTLVDTNMQLLFAQKLKSYHLDEEDTVLLLCFCHLFVNNDDDNIRFDDVDIYDHRSVSRRVKRSLEEGDHTLLNRQFIENTNQDGFGDRESFKLTDKIKQELLGELHIKQRHGASRKGLLLAQDIPRKTLIYNEKEAKQIQQLTALLHPEHFKDVQKRLADRGMRTGFACLFCGPPGTGKTETVYQVARETGRDIMLVDIAETKSMWFGESEKRVKELFDRYRALAESEGITPILLFNESDAVIGKRKDVQSGSVAQTENTMQNIILQEIENLTGILIATTNLMQNMDKAFERRFLYKIEFEKPGMGARRSIWQSMLSGLCDKEAQELASRYDFSGGQIENIARKRTIEQVISGEEPSFNTLLSFCQDELMVKTNATGKIGFSL